MNSVSFPISDAQAGVIAVRRGLDLEADFTKAIGDSGAFLLSMADCIRMVVIAPNVSEGGVSISYGDRKVMLSLANSIYSKFGEPLIQESNPTVEFMKEW